MRLSLVRVVLVLQARDEEVTAARRPYLFSRCLQPAVVAVVAYHRNKPEQTAAAVAARLTAVAVQRAEQEAKETTAGLSPTLSRRLSVQVVVVLAPLVLTAVPCAELAALVRPILEPFMRVAVVLAN